MSWVFDQNDNGLYSGFVRVGTETNWTNVALSWREMVALKSDGTIWKWNFPPNSPADAVKISPTRLGIHSDWVGIANTWGGVVALAADGSLWLWPIGDYENYYGMMPLLKLPKQPEFLGNVFGKPD